MTDAERKLWHALRNRQLDGLKFRRQHPFGRYVLDFLCEERRLAIELDGGQHTADGDVSRTAWLSDRGIRVLRFWNNDVLSNLSGVLETISAEAHRPSEERK
jgi:very-short-patch-repair endonuclease